MRSRIFVVDMSSKTRTRRNNTNWNGILQDLFGEDPDHHGESAHDSSSGIVSTTMSTFKGSCSSSESLLDSRYSGWSSLSNNTSSYGKSCPTHNQPPQSTYNNSALRDFHSSAVGMDSINTKLQYINLEDTGKLILGIKKTKSHPRPSPFQQLSDDIIVKIFSNLTTDQLCKCSRVCKLWYRLIWDPTLWTSLVINNKAVNIDRALKSLTKRLSYNTPTVCIIIEKINLNGCENLTDKGLHTIAKRCPELRHIELQSCSNITNPALFELVSNCVNLEHLNVSGCSNITCVSLANSILARAPAHYLHQVYLLYLDMSDCNLLDDRGLQILALHCSRLQFLYLRRCNLITDAGIQHVATNCTELKDLSISDCYNVTDFGIMELSRLEPDLRYLSVAKCDKISDVGIRYISQHCLKLRYLNCRGCEAISDDSIELLARKCHRLRSLDLGKCDITDKGLFMLARYSPHLKRLSVKSCVGITDRGIIMVAQQCLQLQQLNIQDCHLSVEAYRNVKRFCRLCIIEHTNPGFF